MLHLFSTSDTSYMAVPGAYFLLWTDVKSLHQTFEETYHLFFYSVTELMRKHLWKLC